MAHEIIFHNFASSPFSEKVRLVFGLKNLAWRSVEIPIMLPKPDLLPLTGGYRKTPVMQIGADIYCDTQLIIREIERRHPTPTIFPYGKGLPYALGFWADRLFFMASVPVIFAEIGDALPEAFKKDREAMSPVGFSTEAMKAAAPFMREQWRAHAGFVAEALSNGHRFVQGDQPSVADIHCHMNLWFLKGTLPRLAQTFLEEFPSIDEWYARVTAIGHGRPSPMDAKEALAIASRDISVAEPALDAFDPCGFKPGDAVTVSADDYGRDPVAGEVVYGTAQEIAIRRRDPIVGEVVVHFPRAGFRVALA